MKKLFPILVIILSFGLSSFAQVAQQLIRIHNVSSFQDMINIDSPNIGNLVYVTTNSTIYQYNGNSWLAVNINNPALNSQNWNTTGIFESNSSNNNIIGTTDNTDFNMRTNGQERIVLKAGGSRLLFPDLTFSPNSNIYDSGFMGMNENNLKLRVSSSMFANSSASSIDFYGNNAPGGNSGRLNIISLPTDPNSMAINFRTSNLSRLSMLGNGNFGLNTNSPTANFHINGVGFRYEDGLQANGRILISNQIGGALWQQVNDGPYTTGWALSGGNQGTNPSIHFLGTTDNQPIVFRTNNNFTWTMELGGRLTHGYQAGHIVIGDDQTLNNPISNALTYNIAIGFSALSSVISGENNVAIGQNSLRNNLNQNNVAIGTDALVSNTSGRLSVAIGQSSLSGNTNGSNNVAVGKDALKLCNGIQNTSLGNNSMSQITGGNNNTAVGFNAFNNSSNNYSNSTAIGAGTNITASNQIRFGNNVNSIGGPVGWTTVSDKRFKENISQNVEGLNFVLKLKPITYNINFKAINRYEREKKDTLTSEKRYKELYNVRHIGFLAQEVEALADSLDFDFHGVEKPENKEGMYGLRYAEFIPSLVKAVQEQQKMIDKRQRIIDEQQIVDNQQQQIIDELKRKVEELQK